MALLRLFIPALVGLLLCASNVWADDEPKSGRLPDGRAYRTDKEGNQLIDYIAELEQEIDGLNRRVHGLEDESDQKQRVIDRLSKGASAEGQLSEKNLVGGVSAVSSEKRVAHVAEPVSDSQSAELRTEIASLKQALAQERFQNQQMVSRYEDRISKLSSDIDSVKTGKESAAQAADLARIRELESARDEIDVTRKAHTQEVAKLNSQIEKIEEQLQESQQNFEALKAKYGKLEEKNVELASAKSTAEENLNKQREALSFRTEEAQSREEVAPVRGYADREEQIEERASLSPARIRALDSVRGRINTDLNSLGGKISTRDRLFASYHGSQVQLKPQSTLSSRNETLEQLRQRAQNASNVTELSYIAREVSTIKSRIDDDIALITRMSRAG